MQTYNDFLSERIKLLADEISQMLYVRIGSKIR